MLVSEWRLLDTMRAIETRLLACAAKMLASTTFLQAHGPIRKTFDTRSSEKGHDKGDDRAYVPEASRILIAMAHAAAEIIGSRQPEAPAVDDIRKMITWFGGHAVPGIEQAIGNRRSRSS
jgi:hypothetical protein